MNIDATLIEILDKDMINEDYFLLPDIEYIKGYEQYAKKEIYIPQFPGGGQLSSSKGKIDSIINYGFSHLASTKSGSSGSPIFIKGTIKVIGIHKGGGKYIKENYGLFIGPIIESLKNYNDEEKEGIICQKDQNYKAQILDGFWLRISCPICLSGQPRYWPHLECKKTFNNDSSVKIDLKGNLFCNGCHQISPLLNWKFKCEKHYYENIIDLNKLMEVLLVMISMSTNIDDQQKYAKMISNISLMFMKST